MDTQKITESFRRPIVAPHFGGLTQTTTLLASVLLANHAIASTVLQNGVQSGEQMILSSIQLYQTLVLLLYLMSFRPAGVPILVLTIR